MNDTETQELTFSFVAPVFNEQEGLETFYHRLVAVADKLGEPYEIIFVNDGSSDDSAGVIHRLSLNDPHVKTVEFSRNFGHQAALTAGYDFAGGKAVISLDSDCQHPPELIPDLVARWREGYEVVFTIRQDTAGMSRIRRAIGHFGYKLIRASSGEDLTDQADFRLLDRKVVHALRQVREQARFLRGLVKWIGFKQIGIPYKAERRAAGKSTYTLKQTIRMSHAGLFSFSHRPLRMAPMVGTLLILATVAYVVLSLAMWPFQYYFKVEANLAMVVVALFGLNFWALGLLGEYIGRIFDEAKDRPLYVIRSATGFAQESDQNAPAKALPQDKPQKRFVLYT
jgi:dolichol-phosphate mannosyltransferase